VARVSLHCRAFTVTSFFAREPFHTWRKKGFVQVLTQTGKKRDPRLPDVPTVYELMEEYRTPEPTRRLATVVLAAGEFGRPIVVTPGVPAERIKILREAFSKTLSDPDLVADIKKKKLEVDPTAGEDLEALAKEVITSDRGLIERMKNLLGKQ
jgi:tripartite-type tricarboxylate transporter receptor subunit TctC